jgi:Tfp pilus assembly protein PilX
MKHDIKQNGFVLFVTLVFLLIMTMLALYMFRGFIIDEKLSGNHREKNRSRDAAQAALNAAQMWMSQPGNTYKGNWITSSSPCTAVLASPAVCSAAVPSLTDPTLWISFYNYSTLPTSILNASTSGGAGNYYSVPNYHIQYLGTTGTNPPSALYKVTTSAKGGNDTATTILQAVYLVTAKTRSLGE